MASCRAGGPGWRTVRCRDKGGARRRDMGGAPATRSYDLVWGVRRAVARPRTLRRPPQWYFWRWKSPCASDFRLRRRLDLGRLGRLLALLTGVVAGRLARVADIAVLPGR